MKSFRRLPPPSPSKGGDPLALSAQVKNVNPWHEKLAAWMLVHAGSPGWNRRAAENFGVSSAWISTVVHSDAFQDYYQRLRQETTVPAVFSARERLLGTLDQAIDLVQDKLEKDGSTLTLSNLLDTVDVLAKRTGHGEGKSSSVEISNQVLLVTKEELQESRARMRGSKPLTLDNQQAGTTPSTSQTDGGS